MNKQDRMREQILRHGFQLKRIFFAEDAANGTGISPVALAKALHRIETKAHRIAEQYCNGDIQQDEMDKLVEGIERSLDRLLDYTNKQVPVFVNLDPRGYALKIRDEYVKANGLDIYRDWGGYGILAPEFDGRP